jgi:hypothetical protein
MGDVKQDSIPNEKILSRKKRYLIFPQGSSFSVAVCSTIGIYGNPQFSIFRYNFSFFLFYSFIYFLLFFKI